MLSLDWDHLRVVLALARAGTLSGAADALGVTHTTVSRRLAAFEARLAVRLFDRIDGRFVPTSAGEDVIGAARAMEEDVVALDRRVAGRDAELEGFLRVTTLDVFLDLFGDLLVDFVRAHPKVEVELRSGYGLADLDRREADVALRATNAPASHLVGRRVARMEYALYGARALVAAEGSDPARLPWVVLAAHLGAVLTAARQARYAPDARVGVCVDTYEGILWALRAGLGITFLPVAKGEALADLVRLGPVEPDFGLDVWVLAHPDLRRTARVRAFMEHAATAIVARRDALAGTGL